MTVKASQWFQSLEMWSYVFAYGIQTESPCSGNLGSGRSFSFKVYKSLPDSCSLSSSSCAFTLPPLSHSSPSTETEFGNSAELYRLSASKRRGVAILISARAMLCSSLHTYTSKEKVSLTLRSNCFIMAFAPKALCLVLVAVICCHLSNGKCAVMDFETFCV